MPTLKEQTPKATRGNPIYQPEFADQARRLCASLAATEVQLGEFFGVSRQSITKWKQKYPEFKAALIEGRVTPDDKVELSLYQKAIGYQMPDTHIAVIEGKVVQTQITKHYPPDTTACIFWLKNRRHEQWRDRKDVEYSGESPVQIIRVELVEPTPRTNGADPQHPNAEDFPITH